MTTNHDIDEEIKRLCGLTGLNEDVIIKKALHLYRSYLLSKSSHDEWVVLPRNSDKPICLNELIRIRL
jgi:hypothetical protein